jgi:hypothetical protein
LNALQYEYHDAELLDVSIGPRHETTLTFDLYPIFYPDKPRVAVHLGGIFNFDSVTRYVGVIRQDSIDADSYKARCDTFQMDEKRPSKENDMHVFLELSPYGSIRIHCRHVSETRIQ